MILDVVVGFITGLSVGVVLMAWLMQPAKRERLALPPVKRRRSTGVLAAVPKRSQGGS